jgi:hypothetical protein
MKYAKNNNKIDLKSLLDQSSMFGGIDPMTENIVRGFYRNEKDLKGMLSKEKITSMLKDFVDAQGKRIKEDGMLIQTKSLSSLELLDKIKQNHKNGMDLYTSPAKDISNPTDNLDWINEKDKSIEQSPIERMANKEEPKAHHDEEFMEAKKQADEKKSLASDYLECLLKS